ncbi:MAG TPA: glycosyltransferase family 39 protein [Candidatus Methylomirabilis sp.]|nr:glycosyltransferase family 39 protein [Candidatus Methylomirabilis sp.]
MVPAPALRVNAPRLGSAVHRVRAETLAVLGVSSAALVIRVITLLLTVDTEGDGPSRAMQAYAWSRHPQVIMSSAGWLPGASCWAGIASLLVPDPLIGPRLMNLLLGTLTVPVFYGLIRRLYGVPAALIGSMTLAAMPLHVGLSVSSLSEPSFLFFILAALACLAAAVGERGVRIPRLGLFLLSFVAAEMTRYEVWPLIPLVLLYLYWRTRSASTLVFCAAILLLFPIEWSISSYVHFGQAFYGLQLGMHPVDISGPVSVWTAFKKLGRLTTSHLGWLLSVTVVWGLITELSRAIRGRVDAQRTAYVILVAVVWILIVAGARSTGPALYGRNLLSGFVLALPLAILPFLSPWGRARHRMAIVVAIGALASIGSVTLAYVMHHPNVWVTRTRPAQIVELARWLRESPYRGAAVLATRMKWASTYLPLYAPELSGRYVIVSEWVEDSALRRFIAERKPALLITTAEDAQYRTRIEDVLRHPIPAERRVYSAGTVEVYDLSN